MIKESKKNFPVKHLILAANIWTRAGFLFLNMFLIFGCGTFGSPSYPAGTGAPDSPVKVTATPAKGIPGAIQVTWVPQPATGTNLSYNIYESTNPNVSPAIYDNNQPNAGLPPITITKLKTGTIYYFVVTTIDSFTHLESPPSFPAASALAP